MPKLSAELQKLPGKAEGKYRAPALEKGLDVLELLAQAQSPKTLSQISTHLNRSVNELFRMVQVLEMRGYVTVAPNGDGYILSNKLFSLGVNMGSAQNLLSAAIPIMADLTEKTFQGCHLAVASGDQIVVIAGMEAPGNLSFSVRVGFRRDLVGSTSGVILYSFQREAIRKNWGDRLQAIVAAESWLAFEAQSQQAISQGYMLAESDYTQGITDISCPVFADTGLVAALTMPHIHTKMSANLDDCLTALRNSARRLSGELGG